jgi:hypothetical protein
MTAPDRPPLRAVDWAAVQLAYETSDEPVLIIADFHGISSSAIDHRMRSDGWCETGICVASKKKSSA